jgi:hypothetical protein
LFVDFRAAFYSVLRQGLFDKPMDDTGFLVAMHRLGIAPETVVKLLSDASTDVAIANMSPHALALLQDVLTATCFEVEGW